jgi:general secretion pathway protein J
MATADKQRNCAGFTLIEVLIATTLLGVMMLLLFGSLRIGVTSWDSGEDKMARASRLFLVENFLRNHIGSALPLVEMEQVGGVASSLRGGEDWLEYVSTMPPQIRKGGLYRFRLYVAGNGRHNDLKVAMRPYVANPNALLSRAAEAAEPIEDVVLLENLGQIKFSYLRGNTPIAASFQSTWVPEWQQPQLPQAIQVQIEPEHEEPWPTLMIALRTQR